MTPSPRRKLTLPLLVAASAALVGAALVGGGMRSSDEVHAPAPAAGRATIPLVGIAAPAGGVDGARVSALEARLAALEAGGPAAAPAGGQPSPAGAPGSSFDPDTWAVDIAGTLEDVVEADTPDPLGDAMLAQRLDNLRQSADLSGIEVPELSCGATLCTLEVSAADPAARDRFVGAFTQLIEPGSEGFAYIEDDADLHLSVYLSRGGAPLPLSGGAG
ncbi:MAG: hypothetical protein JNM72_14370 [Deltaproteobacteria bacterium]|nr:hypothetical protein [Deltaproteobacteria bacterium]